MYKLSNVLMIGAMCLMTGCSCWRCQSYVSDIDLKMQGHPRTVNHYWIKEVRGLRKDEYIKRFPSFEKRYPDVFSRDGLPVTIELSKWQQNHNLLKNFVRGFVILSEYGDWRNEQIVEITIDAPSGRIKRFKAHGSYQNAGGPLPLCFFGQLMFDEIHDSRLVEGHVGGYGYDDEHENVWERLLYNDVHAIVLGTAYALMEFEQQDKCQTNKIRIGF